MATISTRVSDEKKQAFSSLCEEMWVSAGTLFNMWINDFLRNKKISIQIDDTHPSYYTWNDVIEVNEDAHVVLDYLHTLQSPHE